MHKEVLEKTDPIIESKKAEGRKISTLEGSATGVSNGLTASYITPFALELSPQLFKPLFIGVLSAISGLMAPEAQLFGSRLMEKHHRKKIVLTFVLWQSLMWLPLSVIAVLKFFDIAVSSLIYLMILVYTLLVILGSIAYPAWFSWMGDIVKENERGKYFSLRNTIMGLVELLAVSAAILILRFAESKQVIILGYAALFLGAFLFRLVSFVLFHKQFVPHFRPMKAYQISMQEFIKQNKNFKKFAYYQLYFNIAIMIASPFFAMYMLEELKFSITTYTIIAISSSIFYLLFNPLVGRFSDKYGNAKLLGIANFAFVLSPIFWMIIKNPVALIIFPQLISGLANSAFAIAFSNFTYDALPERERGIGVAYANIKAGIGTFIGSLIGAFLLFSFTYLPISNASKFFIVFGIAALLRLLVALFFLPKIREMRKVKKLRVRMPIVHIHHLHPFRALHTEVVFLSHLVGTDEQKQISSMKANGSNLRKV